MASPNERRKASFAFAVMMCILFAFGLLAINVNDKVDSKRMLRESALYASKALYERQLKKDKKMKKKKVSPTQVENAFIAVRKCFYNTDVEYRKGDNAAQCFYDAMVACDIYENNLLSDFFAQWVFALSSQFWKVETDKLLPEQNYAIIEENIMNILGKEKKRKKLTQDEFANKVFDYIDNGGAQTLNVPEGEQGGLQAFWLCFFALADLTE